MPQEVRFKAEYRVDRLPFEDGPTRTLSCRTVDKKVVSLSFRHPTQSEIQQGYKAKEAACTASTSRNANPNILTMFESLSRREIPEGSVTDGWEYCLDNDGRIRSNSIISLRMLPPRLQDFASQIAGEFSEAVIRAVGLLRWYCPIAGPHNPIALRSGGLLWSIDESNWGLLSSFDPVLSLEVSFSPGQEEFEAVQQLLDSGMNEPFCHHLFREAWEQKFTNPRSALLLGIASAEVGFKEFVADLVPNAEWLVENVPSPPLVKMLQEYLPIIKSRKEEMAFSSPADEILERLKTGVNLRNKVAHSSNTKMDSKKVLEILYAVLDVLMLLDHYRGFTWSRSYVPKSTP